MKGLPACENRVEIIVSVKDMIRQRVHAKEIAQTAQPALVPDQPAFGLKVWTNKSEGRFLENEKLIIFVQSERDAYLKLDYFQAIGLRGVKVVAAATSAKITTESRAVADYIRRVSGAIDCLHHPI